MIESGATPTTSPLEEEMPATCVPWPWQSSGSSSGIGIGW